MGSERGSQAVPRKGVDGRTTLLSPEAIPEARPGQAQAAHQLQRERLELSASFGLRERQAWGS